MTDENHDLEGSDGGPAPEKKEVLMVIECAISILAVGKGAVIKRDKNGDLEFEPDEKGWRPLRGVDIPEWVKDPGVISDMMDGERVCQHPEDGGRWYRGVVCSTELPEPPAPEVVH